MDNKNTITLEQFISKYDSSREKDLPYMKQMFLSMDRKMKMYHDNNLCITSFRVQDIIISQLFEQNGDVIFDVDFIHVLPIDESNLSVFDNIFYSACLAIGIYNNCLSYIDPSKPHFLKNNFSLFAENMPLDVVPYYRGVIERDACVYLSEYVNAREKQELERMKQEALMDDDKNKNNQIKKEPLTSIDNDTWGTTDAAFSLIALLPILVASLGILIPILFTIIS